MTDRHIWSIPVGDGATTAVWEPADQGTGVVCVCAHGAGGNKDDRAVRAVTTAMCARGIDTVRFNFLYTERGQKRPDPMPQLLACYEAVLAAVRTRVPRARIIAGGRSMGGRAASMLVASGARVDGLLLLAYPLHPPGRPDKPRTGHLPSITPPVLCINGTRDPFCTPELMRTTLSGLGPNWRMLWLDDADHSFHVLKRSGRTNDDVIRQVADAIADWVRTP